MVSLSLSFLGAATTFFFARFASFSLIGRFGLFPPLAFAWEDLSSIEAFRTGNVQLTSASASASASLRPSAWTWRCSNGVKEDPPPRGKSVSSSLSVERKDRAGRGAVDGFGLLGPATEVGLLGASLETRGLLGLSEASESRDRFIGGIAVFSSRSAIREE